MAQLVSVLPADLQPATQAEDLLAGLLLHQVLADPVQETQDVLEASVVHLEPGEDGENQMHHDIGVAGAERGLLGRICRRRGVCGMSVTEDPPLFMTAIFVTQEVNNQVIVLVGVVIVLVPKIRCDLCSCDSCSHSFCHVQPPAKRLSS